MLLIYKEKFLLYFQKNEKIVDHENGNKVEITNVIKSATSDITNAELTLVAKEMQKSCNQKVKYQKAVPDTIKKEVDMYAKIYGTASAIKNFSSKYAKYNFSRTTVNSWKAKCKVANPTFEKAQRPNLLDETLLKKVKDIAIGTRAAGGVINRKQILNIAKGVVRANNRNALKEFGRSLDLTDRWARDVLKQLKWSKRKGTTGKFDPLPHFLGEENFTFQRTISTTILEHDIPAPLAVNLDQTPLSYVSPGKYTFSFKGTKNLPIKKVDDKRQITATFAVSLTGRFLPIQLIYKGKTKHYLPKFKFSSTFSLSYTENHLSNTENSVEFFEQIIFPYLKMVKRENGYPEDQYLLIIMDTFKGQDNDRLTELCSENYCEVVIVPHNLPNKFLHLDISVNKAAKVFIQNIYNEWFLNEVKIT